MFQVKGPVLAAMDLDQGSDELLRQADALARSYHVKLSVCHVLPEIFAVRPLFPQLHLDDALKLYDLSDQMKRLWQTRLDECVHHFKAKGGGLFRDGPAAPAIVSAAVELRAQLLVVGTHGRTGLSRIALGSVAEAVVRAAPCSVLTVRLV
jgi:universal stress protein A